MLRVALICAGFTLAGCANDDLRSLRSNSGGPDEFMILPSKPLQAPETYSELPTPTPGGTNITDPQPKADAIAALGGNPNALIPQGVSSSDAALVSYASRNGVPANVRETVAQEDEAFRERRGRFTQIRLFRVDRYEQVYQREKLDPFAQERRARSLGIATPTNPPEVP